MAKQLAFQQSRRDGGAVHLDEVAILAPAHAVNHAGDAFFARPGFTGDKDRAIGIRDDGGVVQHTLQGWAVADDIVSPVRTPDFVFQITLLLGEAVFELCDLAIGVRILKRSGDLVGYLLQVFNLRRAESILVCATRIQRSPDSVARDQGYTANRPNPGFKHGFRQGFLHVVQIVCGEECHVSRLDRPRRECLFERNRASVVNESLPFQSISIQVHVLAIRVQQGHDGTIVARDAPKAGENSRQQFFRLEAGTQFTADRDQALLFFQSPGGFFLLQRERSHQRDAREEFDVLLIQHLGNVLAQAKRSKMF